MKIKAKTGEHFRVQTDGENSLMFYIGRTEAHITVQPPGQPTRIIVADLAAKIEPADTEVE